jgi:DNA-binding transcriptional LysR family regulator
MASGYTHARAITVKENDSRALPRGHRWVKAYRKGVPSPLNTDEWLVRSDAGVIAVHHDTFATLTEARKHARAVIRSNRSTWAEVRRYAESGYGITSILWAEYERELIIK